MLGVGEAAARLGVSTRQVQNLVASGGLRAVARGYVDEASVERLLTIRRGRRARAWSGATAWGAIGLLSGMDVGWMGKSQRSRLRRRLADITAEELIALARNRAVARRYAGHPSAVKWVRDAAISTHLAARRLGLADSSAVDVYVAAEDLDALVRSFALVADDGGWFTLRVTTMQLDVVSELATDADVLAALDLAESLDVREQGAGVRVLDQALESFR